MTERPHGPASDEEFDAALRARRRLLPRFEVPQDEDPSPELDRRVLARARDALRLESPPERFYRGPRWAVPLALAATVLLSIGLVTQLDPTRNDAVLATGSDAATSPVMAERAADPPAAADAAAMARADRSLFARERASAMATAERRAARVGPAFVADAPAEAGHAQAADSNSAESADLETARAEVDATLAKAAPAAASPPTSMPPAPSMSSRQSAAAQRSAIPRDDPQRWLAAIEQLQRTGEIEAARTELVAFRRRHPDQALPETLERLLR